MSANLMLCGMVAASALAMAVGSRSIPAPEPEASARSLERPWLTPEAAAQVIGEGGMPGPLFSGIVLGGPAPSRAVEERIGIFAQRHGVDIHLDVADGKLAAVRFDVTYGGCCGYEGADVLALRLARPTWSECCGCGGHWIDDWAFAIDGVNMRVHMKVNRVEVRWEHALTLPEVVARADALLDADPHHLATTATASPGQLVVEAPLGFTRADEGRDHSAELGYKITVEHDRIVEVAVVLRDRDDSATRDTLRARWGRPRISDDTWTWQKPDRVVTASLDGWRSQIAIRRR